MHPAERAADLWTQDDPWSTQAATQVRHYHPDLAYALDQLATSYRHPVNKPAGQARRAQLTTGAAWLAATAVGALATAWLIGTGPAWAVLGTLAAGAATAAAAQLYEARRG